MVAVAVAETNHTQVKRDVGSKLQPLEMVW
jgi:hypothetical protein